jgi:ribose transport system substrate-binding protein
MSRKRVVIWTVVGILVAAGLIYRASVYRQPPPPPASKVAFVTGGSGTYWQLTVDGAKAAAAKHNVDLQVEMPAEEESVEEQVSILGRIDLGRMDGLAFSPLDAEGQTDFINQLVRREKKVVTFDSDAPLSTRQSHIGTSNFAAGRACARMVNDAMPNGGKIAVLLANQTKENLIDRKGGFHERIAQMADDVEEGQPLKFVIVGYFEDNGNAATCEKNVKAVLAEHPDLGAIVGMNSKHGPILLKVLKEAGKLGQIKLITFDEAEETLKGVEEGYIYATLAQDPYRFGYEAVSTLAALCSGDETSVPIVGRGSTYISAEAIRQENVEDFRARLKTRQKPTAASTGEKKAA